MAIKQLFQGLLIGLGISIFALSLSIVGATILCAANSVCQF